MSSLSSYTGDLTKIITCNIAECFGGIKQDMDDH